MEGKTTLEGYINLIKEVPNIPRKKKKLLINGAYELLGIDEKTQLHNYSYLVNNLSKSISTSQRKPESELSIYLLDIDDFKKYNEKPYNKILGDRLLRMVANACKENIERETDFVARYGGDENIGVFPKTSKYKVSEIAEKVRESIKSSKVEYIMPPKNKPVNVSVTASIGVGSVNDVPHIKILHSRIGNKLFTGFLRGEYSDLVKEFSKETGVSDKKVNVCLNQLKNAAEAYIEENKLSLTPEMVFDPNRAGLVRKEMRKYIEVESFIGEIDKMLQKAKDTSDRVVVLPSPNK